MSLPWSDCSAYTPVSAQKEGSLFLCMSLGWLVKKTDRYSLSPSGEPLSGYDLLFIVRPQCPHFVQGDQGDLRCEQHLPTSE